jgi:predicted transcriptional regulator
MKVKDLGFFGKYVKVKADDPVSEAAKEMVKQRALDVMVVDDNSKVIGFVTYRKILEEVVAKGLDPNKVKSKEVVSTNFVTISAEDDVKEAIIKYTRYQIDVGSDIPGLIVLAENKFAGVIPIADMYAAVSPQALYQYAMLK